VDKTCGAVVPFIISDVPSLLSRLHLLEQKRMIAFFDPENRVYFDLGYTVPPRKGGHSHGEFTVH
jgi:hypothetical protein